MNDFFNAQLFKFLFTEDIKINTGMAIILCMLLVLGTRAIRSFLTVVDMVVIPLRELCVYVNKWTNGFLFQFFWVGNCGLWLMLGTFLAAFGFQEYRIDDIKYLPSSISYGLGWTGVCVTVISMLAITRMWLRLEDPKKKKIELPKANKL